MPNVPTYLLVAAVMLAACTPDASAPVVADQCGAAALQDLVGQPAAVLQTMRFGTVTRITRPGDAVTMDYVETRLNIRIDGSERIEAVSCG